MNACVQNIRTHLKMRASEAVADQLHSATLQYCVCVCVCDVMFSGTHVQGRTNDDRSTSTQPIRERLTEIRVLAQDEDDIGARVSRGHLAMDSLKDAKVVYHVHMLKSI